MTDKPPKRSRHGLNAVMAKVKLRGLAAIDTRTVAARELLEWKRQLIADLGGEAAITAAQMGLIESAVVTRALISHANAWLLEQPSLVNKRRKELPPIVEQRQALCDALARYLNALGLKRVDGAAGTLEPWMIEKVQPPADDQPEPPQKEEAE